MRISPIANYYQTLSKTLSETSKATYPSHNNPETYAVTQAVSTCILLSRQGYSKDCVKKLLKLHLIMI